jgi:purine-binding chemotaxis protein CheW
VPIHDLADRLGVTCEPSDDTKIVIIETETETAGVIVDHVEEVLTIEDEQIEEVPGAGSTLIDSIAKIDQRLVVLLKPSTIFTADPIAA